MADKAQTKETPPKKDDEKPKTGAQTFMGGPVPTIEPVADTAQTQLPDPTVTEDVKPPKGAYVEDTTQPEAERLTERGPLRTAATFDDEFAGVGGRYVIDPETGDRQPVYEKYTDADGATKYRKAA